MKRFLKGKMYNRCCRGHLLLSSAFHGLHFKRFLEDVSVETNVLTQLEEWNNLDDEEPTSPLITLATKYQRFSGDTLSGKLGKTAQFWIIYCKIMELYLTMHRAVKINSIELYAYSLFQLTSLLFFSTNH